MSDVSERDEMRLCPVCRVPISVLATRCRHCGEEVGRPRKEEHKLTVRDLGGAQQTNYTVSGNVMDALEAFREEQISSQEVERRQREAASGTWFGRKPTEAGEQRPRPRGDDLPDLDPVSRDLADLNGLSASGSRPRPQPRRDLGPTPTERVMKLGGLVGVIALLMFLAWWGYGRYQEHLAEQEALLHPVRVSRATEDLAAGKPVLDVLSQAVDDFRATDSPENRAALDAVRARAMEEIEKLLNAPQYARETLDRASMLATRAALVDSDQRVQELDKRVKAELDTYGLVLMSIDVKRQRAKFKLHDPNFPMEEQEVGVGDDVGGRFVVQSILENQVRLVDRQRKSPTGQRSIIARPQEPVSGA